MSGEKESNPSSSYVLEDQVGFLLRQANQRHAAIFSDRMGDLGLTPRQFAALVKMRDENEVSQNRLGRLTAMDRATIQGVVRRLRERGLVVERPDPDDRRRSLWRLSPAGETLLAKALVLAVQITRETLAPLSERERGTLIALLTKVA